MASLTQILSNPGMAIALPAIQGEGYRLAGLPDLPTNYIWDYQVNTALPASDPNAWLPALDLVKIQRETGPTIADNLLAMGKFALSIFTSPSVLDLGSLYQSTEKLAAQELAITASVEAKTEQLQQAVLLRRAQETQPMFDDFGWDSIGDFFSDSYDSIARLRLISRMELWPVACFRSLRVSSQGQLGLFLSWLEVDKQFNEECKLWLEESEQQRRGQLLEERFLIAGRISQRLCSVSRTQDRTSRAHSCTLCSRGLARTF